MKLAVFSSKSYDKKYLLAAHAAIYGHGPDGTIKPDAPIQIDFLEFSLCAETAPLVHGVDAVCVFVNDNLTAPVLETLHSQGVRGVLLRCAGYNNVDLQAAERLGMFVANVPSYSPEAVGEFAVALIQTLNRKTHRAYNRVREGNFSLDGLLGKTLNGKTVGIVGTGRIGVATARIMKGFGCHLVAFDPNHVSAFTDLGGEYLELDDLLPKCDIISLHCPLFEKTRHIINATTLAKMKPGAMLVNTSRGGLVDTAAAITALKSRHLGGLALDVYEGEGELFYNDHSAEIIKDDELMRLMTFPNVIVCGHQAFFTEEALQEISECTLRNVSDFMTDKPCKNSLVKDGNTLSRRESHPVRTV